MEVDRTYTKETTRINHQSHGTPQGREEEVGHETPGRETQKKIQKRWGTPGKKWRRWPQTENSGVP